MSNPETVCYCPLKLRTCNCKPREKKVNAPVDIRALLTKITELEKEVKLLKEENRSLNKNIAWIIKGGDEYE